MLLPETRVVRDLVKLGGALGPVDVDFDIVRFVSILSRRARSAPSMPVRFPSGGKWLLKILAREDRFVVGLYRREMRAISYLGKLDQLFGVPVTTRNWNTITAIGRVLGGGGT